MVKFEYETLEQLVTYAKEAEGKYLVDLDKNNLIKNTNVKGSVGHIIENGYFGYDINSNAKADFEDVGVELKATGIIKMKKNNTYKAKERLVLNIINYEKEASQDFFNSSFWTKNQKLLLFFYEYVKNAQNKMDREATQIKKVELFEFPEEDLKIIKQDWDIIHNKIMKGEAHLLSEGDTMILGACTKGSTAEKSLRNQPFSDIKAKQRAFSLKQGYMTSLVRKFITQDHLESITNTKEIAKQSLEEIIQNKFKPYIGLTDIEISKKLNVKITNSKNMNQILTSKILGVKGIDLDKIEEFEKYNIKFKTIMLKQNGMPKEHMSFKQIHFEEYINSTWDDSPIKDMFESTKWLFVVFQLDKNNNKILKQVKLWHMPAEDIENHLKAFFESTQNILKQGVVLIETKRGIKNNLPGSKDNPICHIRPKAINASDQYKLPDGQSITKQAFWLNAEYIKNILG